MDADREAVRRRLYGRGATEEDLRRYRALAPDGAAGAGVPAARPGPEERAAPAHGRRARRRVAFGAVGLVVLLGVALLPGVVGRAPGPLRTTSPTARPARAAGLPDVVFADAGTVFTRIGDGSELVPLDTDVIPASGAMTIALAPAIRAPIGWRVIRSGAASSVTTDQVLAASTSAAARGAPVLLRFEGAAPNRVAVDAPTGERWTLVVTFLRGRSG